MKKTFFLFVILAAFTGSAYANACASAATGNWSAAGTWTSCGGTVPGIGDTATIAHTVTVDVNTTVGTSPNNTTTNVVAINGSKSLVVAATLTIRGNFNWANGATLTMNAGSAIVFDNAASGGSPVYLLTGGGFNTLTINGSSGSPCSISAISGQKFSSSGNNWTALTATYATFQRQDTTSWTANSGSVSIDHCTFDSCGLVAIFSSGTTVNASLTNNTWQNSTDRANGTLKLQYSGTYSSGTRLLQGNALDLYLTYSSKSYTILQNYFGGGVSCANGSSVFWTAFRNNFVRHDGTLNARFNSSAERNYFVVDGSAGNPHFVYPEAPVASTDVVMSQNIFEGHEPDLVDTGDCLLVKDAMTAGSNQIIGKNNITLPMSYPGTTVTSGQLLTAYNGPSTASTTSFYRNTVNVDNSSVVGLGKRGAFAVAEGSANTTIQNFKSNLAWGSSSGQGFLGERVSGNVKDLIVAAGADYNWVYNTSTGDNQRSYEDKAASNTLWTAGDAVAAAVDSHQGSGNPSFYDSSRSVTAWATARGYGDGSYSAGLTALQAAPSTQIADLINYVFEGFRPGNSSMRNAAHDGGVVGAANYYKSTRTTAGITAHRAKLSKFGL